MSDAVLVERRGRILVITINRPQARNAINLEVSQALADAMDELDDRPDLSVAILTGAGGNFCSGMDLKAFAAGERVAVAGRGLGFAQKPPRVNPSSRPSRDSHWPAAPNSCWRPIPSWRLGRRDSAFPRSGADSSPVPAGCCGCRGRFRTRRRSNSR